MHTIYTIHIKRKRRVKNFLENISTEEEKTASKTEKGKDITFIEIFQGYRKYTLLLGAVFASRNSIVILLPLVTMTIRFLQTIIPQIIERQTKSVNLRYAKEDERSSTKADEKKV